MKEHFFIHSSGLNRSKGAEPAGPLL